MDRKLIHYLPYAIRDFAEYRGIAAGEQPEFELAWDAHGEVFANQFVDTALDYGLSRWEKMLGITPKAADTLELRRSRIKFRLAMNTPYTFRWLERWLDAVCGAGNHTEAVTDYTLDLRLNYGEIPDAGQVSPEIGKILEEILPENITWLSRFWMELRTEASAGGAFIGSRRRERAKISVPPLRRPGGGVKVSAAGGFAGSAGRVTVRLRADGVRTPTGAAATCGAVRLFHCYQRVRISARNPAITNSGR